MTVFHTEPGSSLLPDKSCSTVECRRLRTCKAGPNLPPAVNTETIMLTRRYMLAHTGPFRGANWSLTNAKDLRFTSIHSNQIKRLYTTGAYIHMVSKTVHCTKEKRGGSRRWQRRTLYIGIHFRATLMCFKFIYNLVVDIWYKTEKDHKKVEKSTGAQCLKKTNHIHILRHFCDMSAHLQ